MRVVVTISTPKHAHIWKHAIKALRSRGHDVLPLLRDYRETLTVARGVGIEGPVFGRCTGAGVRRALEYPSHTLGYYRLARRFKPDLLAGYGLFESHAARLLRRPAIGWNDTELAPGQNTLISRLATVVMVPSSFNGNQFGAKQQPFSGFLECAYLHPNRYKPNPDVLDVLGVKPGEKYALVRLNAMDATHDVGAQGFTNDERTELVRRLAKHGRVFVSPEAAVPADLQPYVLPTPKHRIHDVLAFAALYVGDSGTMQNEASLLGTPSVRYTKIPESQDRGNSLELEHKFGLLANIRDAPKAIDRAETIFTSLDPRGENAQNVQRMLDTQIDVSAFMVWFIENYPRSLHELQADPDAAQAPFRGGRDWLATRTVPT